VAGDKSAPALWGVKVANVEVKQVDLPESTLPAMAKQAEMECESGPRNLPCLLFFKSCETAPRREGQPRVQLATQELEERRGRWDTLPAR
jgi:hypothetical protein